MDKKKMAIRIGNKVLSLDNPDQVDEQFKRELEAVGQTNPANLQEFFERLVELQRRNSEKASAPKVEHEEKQRRIKRGK